MESVLRKWSSDWLRMYDFRGIVSAISTVSQRCATAMHIRVVSSQISRDLARDVAGISLRIDVDTDGKRLSSWVLGHLGKIRVAHCFLCFIRPPQRLVSHCVHTEIRRNVFFTEEYLRFLRQFYPIFFLLLLHKHLICVNYLLLIYFTWYNSQTGSNLIIVTIYYGINLS